MKVDQAVVRPQAVPFFPDAGRTVSVFDKVEKRVGSFAASSGARLSSTEKLTHLRRYSFITPMSEPFPFLGAALIGHYDLLRPADLSIAQKISSDKSFFVQRAQVGDRLHFLQHPDRVWIYRHEPRRTNLTVSEQNGYISFLLPLDADQLVVGTFLGDISLVDVRDGRVRSLGRPFSGTVWAGARSDDGTLLALASVDHTVRLLGPAGGARPRPDRLLHERGRDFVDGAGHRKDHEVPFSGAAGASDGAALSTVAGG